ncbi:MAG: Cell surface protein, partial [Chthonomonadales bacterium]|nr:Cell surface protein [Chthonomonadales bacterium]
MQRHHSLFIGLLLVAASGAQSQTGPNNPSSGVSSSHKTGLPARTKQKSPGTQFGRLPLSFESNRGQTNSQVRFLTHTADSTLFLSSSEAVFSMALQPQPESTGPLKKEGKAPPHAEKLSRVALRMQMVGADPKATPLEQRPLAGRVNYIIGRHQSRWHTGVPTFGRVGFHQVYSGVDVVYYGNQQHLEYDFVVAPHADPSKINLHFDGAQQVRVNAAGDLLVHAHGRELTWQKPTAYQQDKRGKQTVAARFQLKPLPDGRTGVRFALGHYDTTRALVIDPVLIYSTFLGGTPSGARGDRANGIAVDSAGSAYVAGQASSVDFPTTAGAYQTFNDGNYAFVSKLNSTGTALVYSTFLGGSDAGQQATAIAVDSNGDAIVVGNTTSPNFPVTSGALKTVWSSQRGATAFVTKLNATGTGLIYSTLLGGSSSDYASAIVLDSSGNAFITGSTTSPDFPITSGAFQTVYKSKGSGNAYVTKLNSTGSAVIYSTFLGGTGANPGDPVSDGDAGTAITIDGAGNAYVTGPTSSTDFPTTANAPVRNFTRPAGSTNTISFVTELNPTGAALVYSTYLGGIGQNTPSGIAIDSSGNICVVGATTAGGGFPTDAFSYQRYTYAPSGTSTGYFAKINLLGRMAYSTYLGGTGGAVVGDIPTGLVLDSSDNAYIVGYTGSPNFPVKVGSFQSTKALSSYATGFVTKINAAGTALPYSTYLGGAGGSTSLPGDIPLGIALDSSGSVYVAGYTYSSDFPVTRGAFQTVNHTATGGFNAFVTKLSPIPIYPDFNNDGFVDLLLQNPSTGAISNWFMQGATKVGNVAFSLSPPTEYTLVGAGDFSGNGMTTLAMQNKLDN